MSVSRGNPVALYLQIANVLKDEILTGKLEPGVRIGTQKELEERFDVSKITVRKAIEILEGENFVTTIHGKGTFVKKAMVEQTLDKLQSLTDIIKKSGFNPQVKVERMEVLPLHDEYVSAEAIESLYIERLHIVEDKPIALAEAYIPYEWSQHFTKDELQKHTIYDLLENKLNISLDEAVQSIEASPASASLGEKLGVKEGSPILKAKRYTYSTDQKLVEKITFYYRYDVFAFKVNLNRASITPMWPNLVDDR
ncbi:MAG TPA: GntR family transcriptional regulator [Bacillota bacterium]|nr:GntR family transcriptional regulator [Bacillota bacterium]